MFKIDKNKLIRIEIDEDNLDDYIGYFNLIKEGMPNPDFLMDLDKKYLIRMLKRGSHIFVYFYDSLIVSSAMMLPCDRGAIKETGLDLDYHEVIEFGPQFVHPDYRGNGIQYYMIDDIRFYAYKLGFRYALGVVDAKNEFSNKNASKWSKVVEKIKINGKDQNVYCNDLLYNTKINVKRDKIKREELDIKDIIYYNHYIHKIRNNMERPEFLGTFENEELKELLKNDTHIYVYKNNDEVISSSMLIPSTEKDLKKFGIDLDYKEVVDYGTEVVSEKYRGNGLQQYMLDELEKISKKKGYKYAITTIHPDNIYSINNILKNGFEFKGFKEFKRGPRNIYLKKYFID